jgi:hypothetical protein
MSTTNLALVREVESLRRVAAAITAGRLADFRDGPHSHSVRFSNPSPLRAFGPLRGAMLDGSVSFAIRSAAGLPDGWRIELSSYVFALLDRNGREVLTWHWHLGREFAGPNHPHLHVSAAVRFPDARGEAAPVVLDKLHLPTGVVLLPSVVRAPIEECGVQPLAWVGTMGNEVFSCDCSGSPSSPKGWSPNRHARWHQCQSPNGSAVCVNRSGSQTRLASSRYSACRSARSSLEKRSWGRNGNPVRATKCRNPGLCS